MQQERDVVAPRNKMVIAVEEVGKSIDVLSEALSEALTGMLGAYGKLETAMSASAGEVAPTKPAGKPSTASTGRRANPVPVDDDEDLDEEPAPRRGRPAGPANKPTTRRVAPVEDDEDDDVDDAPVPARRGRPPGQTTPKRVQVEVVDDEDDDTNPQPAKRGRPAGSTNKPRATAAPVPTRKPRPVAEPEDDDFNDDDFDDSDPVAEADGDDSDDSWQDEWQDENDEPAPKAGRRGR